MLTNFLKNNKAKPVYLKNNIPVGEKHFPSPIREWNNSIYVYNKHNLKSIPFSENLAMRIIKGYFSIYNRKLEKIARTKKMLRRLRKYSSNKIYISQGEFKHTNNKVLINLYLYNRQRNNYISFLKSWYKNFQKKRLTKIFVKRLKVINKKALLTLKKSNEKKILMLNILNGMNNNVNTITQKNVSKYLNKFYITIIHKSIRKIKLYYYYKQLLYTNKCIINYNFLQYLKKYMEYIYNKNVEFNLINLKRFFLNSDIMSESITLKISRNRRKLLKFLNTLKNKVKILKKRPYLSKSIEKINSSIKFNTNSNNKSKIKNFVLYKLKYRRVTGFRLQGKGRLTRRYTASRSISKLKYRGNLLDINSSYRGLSTVLLRGNLKSNLQSTKIKSKTRIGSFGIKGWISGN